MGTLILAAASKPASGSSDYSFLLIILVIFGIMYFVMIRPQRNRQRQAQQTQRQVGNGARVRTTAGMYGTIVDGDDNNVLVEFAPGVRIKMMRRAIMGVVPDDEADGLKPTGPDTSEQDSTVGATKDDRGDSTF
jgi:preprotein translocase subunit YajC